MDMHLFVSWNIRGFANHISKFNIKSVIIETRAKILCIQETKIHLWCEKSIKSPGVGKNVGWLEAPSVGLSGGIIIVWDKDCFIVIEAMVKHFWIGIKGYCVQSKIEFACINVYAP